jgi:uncharacterized Zn finger protein
MKATLLAKSSSGEPYNVEFLTDGGSLRVFCHCQAGVLQRMCKHKLAFILCDAKMLFDSNQASLLSEIHTWPEFGNLKAHATEYEKQLAEIESAQSALTKKEKTIKAAFAHGLSHGFK